MPDSIDLTIERSLDSLLLSNQVRELIGYPKPVSISELSRTGALVTRVAKLVCRSRGQRSPRGGGWRLTLVESLTIVMLRVLLHRLGMRRAATVATIWAVWHRRHHHGPAASEVTGYVSNGDSEEPLIKICLSLRMLGYYGACVEFLVQRFHSGLPAEQTRYWLAFFLKEIGDRNAADQISPSSGRRETTARTPSPNGNQPPLLEKRRHPRLKYGFVILTMLDSDAFRSSVLSLLDSDFQGEVVIVEEGHVPEKACQSFCQKLPVKYIKSPGWNGMSAGMNLGIEQLEPDTDIVVAAHNDVLWSPRWFESLNEAWEKVYDTDKVGVINLGFLEFDGRLDDIPRDLFVRGRYDDLAWVLKVKRDVGPLATGRWGVQPVQDIQVRDKDRLFGLARLERVRGLDWLEFQTRQASVAVSYPAKTWRDIGGFDLSLRVGWDLELHAHFFENRQWVLWINNQPLVHMRGSDVHSMSNADKLTYAYTNMESREGWEKKYGWDQDHYLLTYTAETSIIHHDQIVDAANELRFSDIDFVFDDFFERLEAKKLSSCELVWCPSRPKCRYI